MVRGAALTTCVATPCTDRLLRGYKGATHKDRVLPSDRAASADPPSATMTRPRRHLRPRDVIGTGSPRLEAYNSGRQVFLDRLAKQAYLTQQAEYKASLSPRAQLPDSFMSAASLGMWRTAHGYTPSQKAIYLQGQHASQKPSDRPWRYQRPCGGEYVKSSKPCREGSDDSHARGEVYEYKEGVPSYTSIMMGW